MNVRLAEAAKPDVANHAAWYEQKSMNAMLGFLAELDSFIDRIGSFPQLYEQVRRSPKARDVRQGTLSDFPYVVVYEVRADEIVTLSVTHGHQRNHP